MSVAAAIAAYRPKNITDELWDTVGPLVRARVAAAKPGGKPAARALLSSASGLAIWAAAEHIPLEPETLFSVETAERYATSCLTYKQGTSASTVRSRLRRLCLVNQPRLTATIHASVVQSPYSTAEVATLRQAAALQPTEARRQRLTALIGLAAGCGCNPTDLRFVYGTDVTRSASGAVEVSIGGPRARTVTCLAEYEDDLATVAAAVGGDLLIGGTGSPTARNLVSRLTSSMVADRSVPKLRVARLRSTWMVTMLSAAVPLAWLMEAAGVTGTRSLVELLEYVPTPDPQIRAQVLRNAGSL